MNLMKSRKFVRILFVMALCIGIFAVQAFAATQDLKGKASFSYPEGWTPTETEANGTVAVMLMNSADPMTNVTVTLTEKVPAGTALPDEAAFRKQIEDAMTANGGKVEVIESKKTTMGGKDAVLIEYKAEMNGMQVQYRQTMAINGDNMLIVMGTFMDMSKVEAGRKVVMDVEKSVAFK